MKSKSFKIVCFTVCAFILVFVLALNVAVVVLHDMIDKWVVGYKDAVDGGSGDRAAGAELAEQIQYEGSVLVKNDNDTLPLDKSTDNKVNVFGWASTDWVYSGSGSGQVKGAVNPNASSKATKLVDLLTALTDYGIEYNTALSNMYNNFMGAREYAEALHSFSFQFSRLYEPKIDDTNYYTETMLAEAEGFSDTALVVLGRITGESNDAPKIQYKRTERGSGDTGIVTDADRTYLEISTEEEALLKYVGAHFENVIVIINSTNVMELGFMETIEGLDSCLIVGSTGTSGATAIPKMLYGEYTPSGKTADTYAYDLSTSSTYTTVGAGVKGANGLGEDTTAFYTNGGGLYPTTVSHTNGNPGSVPYTGVAYTDYVENIYMGYKWYETADAMGFWDSAKAKSQWGISNGYQDVVQYPFGYGLSYTSFEWEVTIPDFANNATVTEDDVVDIFVKVTNVGTAKGQDVVEVYYTAPYTKGGIEKSAVNLVGFSKTTNVLEPGASQTVEIKVKVEDMKSYDCYDKNNNGFMGYELEAGNYVISLRSDAHTPAGDKVKSGSDSLTLHVASGIQLDEDDASGNPVANRFTGSKTTDGVAIDGSDSNANIVFLSRDDFEGTFSFERAANREMADNVRALNLYTRAMAQEWANPDDKDIIVGETPTIVYDSTKGADGNAVGINDLGMSLGDPENFDNEKMWDPVLNSLTLAEMQSLVLHGYTKTSELKSIGKPQTQDLDGPNQIGSFANADGATGFSSIVLAQSWNSELAYSMGLTFSAEAAAKTVNGWYGPGVNVHRSPFGGRNFEYFSEDSYLSGIMSARQVQAAKNGGVFAYLKHICLYESESGRDGMYNWLTEQSLREVYLKPFEICVKEGGATGIMTSYGRIGAVWTGGSEALLTELVRGEWGFKGAFLTDYADHHEFMNGDQMLRAGGDLWMDGAGNNGSFRWETDNNSFRQALRKASKNIIFMWLNALATNKDYNERIANGEIDGVPIVSNPPELKFRWYIPVLIALDVIAVAGCGFWIFTAVRKKGEPEAEAETETGSDDKGSEE